MGRRNCVSNLALVGLLLTIGLGAWFVAQSVVSGEPLMVLLKLVGSIIVGSYYLIIFYVSLGYSLTNRFQEPDDRKLQ
jgi:hypothetical protein